MSKYLRPNYLTDKETKKLKSEIKEYLKHLDEIRETVETSQGAVGQWMKNIKKLYKDTSEKAKQSNSKIKNDNEEVLDLKKWFYGSKEMKSAATELRPDYGFLGKTANKMSDEFSKELNNMIQGYTSFTESIKRIGENMVNYIVKSAVEGISGYIFSPENLEAATKGLGKTFGDLFKKLGKLGKGGKAGIGGLAGFIGVDDRYEDFTHKKTLWQKVKDFFGIGRLFHSGGVVPVGANYSIPGAKEQLAILKGGERILSPSENVSYSGSQSSSPVVINSFNVKAWDSKDVSKYLLENKQLLNAITFEGIKNNNSQLRTIVQNA